ncbi:MAG: hypothetical protein ACK4GJ_03915 [bacterium]
MDLQSDFLKNSKNIENLKENLKLSNLKNFKNFENINIDIFTPLPARYGRIINQNKFVFIIQLILYLSIGIIFILNMDKISFQICNLSIKIIEIFNLPLDVKINQTNVFKGLYYLSEVGKLPSLYLSFYTLIISCILMLIFNAIHIPKFLKIWVNFVLIVLVSSCLYFIFIPYKFPYTLEDFSLLYSMTSTGIISIMAFIVGLSLSFLSYRKWLITSNFLIFCLIIAYSFVFNSIRYVVFLYVLKEYSSLWMANLYFNFGPLLDMIYISGIWGVYLSFLSKYIKENPKHWRWLY